MFGNIYGLDLGTYEIKVYDKKKNAIWREKNTIAIANEDEIFLWVTRHMRCLKKRLTI